MPEGSADGWRRCPAWSRSTTSTSGFPALSAHVLVERGDDCHARRRELEELLLREYGIEHTTLQVDHVTAPGLVSIQSRR